MKKALSNQSFFRGKIYVFLNKNIRAYCCPDILYIFFYSVTAGSASADSAADSSASGSGALGSMTLTLR